MKNTQLILEYSSDKVTLDISRAIVKRFKQFIFDEEIPNSEELINIGLFYFHNKKVGVAVIFYEGTKVLADGVMHLHEEPNKPLAFKVIVKVMYRPMNIKSDFNAIVTEIKEAVRHEIEHVAQVIKDPIYTPGSTHARIEWSSPAAIKAAKSGEKTKKDLYDYYMQDHEVEAFTKGLFKKAKTTRVDFEKLLFDWLESRNLSTIQKWRMKHKYYKYAEKHGLFHGKPISKTYTQNNESLMNSRVVTFGEFQKLNEGNGLKALVGKEAGEDLNVDDAKRIGSKISKMKGKMRQKYIGIVNFMGASCKVFNAIWANYKPVDKDRKTKNEAKPFNKDEDTSAMAMAA